jgi:hypothetical protein
MYSTVYSNDSVIVNEKPSPDKITLIFDLDETFITTINDNIYQTNYMTLGPHRFIVLKYKIPMNEYSFEKTSDTLIEETNIIAIRPGFLELKNFLLDNMKYFNIGFWSTGYHTRVKAVVDLLFPELKDNITVLIGKEYSQYSSKNYVKNRDTPNLKMSERTVFYDILKKKKLKFEGYLSGSIVKRVDLLCDLPEYRDILHKNRTILIDDLPNNVIVNHPQNTIWVNAWDSNHTCDDTLKKLMQWLDKHKTVKSFAKVKMPNYAKDSKFNLIISKYGNKLEQAIESQKVCDALYNGHIQSKSNMSKPIPKTKKQIERKLKKVILSKSKKTKKADTRMVKSKKAKKQKK